MESENVVRFTIPRPKIGIKVIRPVMVIRLLKCPRCGVGFPTMPTLNKHLKDEHHETMRAYRQEQSKPMKLKIVEERIEEKQRGDSVMSSYESKVKKPVACAKCDSALKAIKDLKFCPKCGAGIPKYKLKQLAERGAMALLRRVQK